MNIALIKKFFCLTAAFMLSIAAFSQDKVLNIWDAKAPGKVCKEDEEIILKGDRNYKFVSVPTISIYKVESETPAPAVLICPGGGYGRVCIEHEGTEIAKWLNSIGFTAVILKYRIPENRDGAFADAQRALRLIRYNAKAWNIDPNRLGMLGFSAGGHLTARTSTSFNIQAYEPTDAADKLSARPDFSVLVYPAYLYTDANYTLPPEIKITKDTPPVFITQAQDDVKYFDSSIAYYLAAKKMGVKADIHLFADGGHGKGVRRTQEPMKDWHNICGEWLKYYFLNPSKK